MGDVDECPREIGRAPQVSVTHVINSLGIGGAERQLALLAIDVAGEVAQKVRPLVRAPELLGVAGVGVVGGTGPAVFSILRALLGAARDCLDSNNVLLIGWMYHSWLVVLAAHLLSFRRGKVLLYCRHGDPATLSRATRLIAVNCLRLARALQIAVVFNSNASRVAHLGLVPRLITEVVPNGVRLAVSSSPQTLRKGHRRVIGFLGRNHRDKGSDRLLEVVPEALSKYSSVYARICGPGIEKIRSEMESRLTGLNVDLSRLIVSGAVSDIDEFYGSIDILVVPSRTESFPNVVIEAASRGVVPVCIGVGEVPSILAGLVDVADDLGSLKRILCQVCAASAAEIDSVSQRLIVEMRRKFSIEEVARQHLKLWREVVGVV